MAAAAALDPEDLDPAPGQSKPKKKSRGENVFSPFFRTLEKTVAGTWNKRLFNFVQLIYIKRYLGRR